MKVRRVIHYNCMYMETEYRTIYKFTFGSDNFLQFKSTKEIKSWPWFWRVEQVPCWRFVPKRHMLEHECPIELSLSDEAHVVSCTWGSDNNGGLRLFPLVKEFPDINDYLNSLK